MKSPTTTVLLLLVLLSGFSSPGLACVGDLNGDRRVTVDELIRCIPRCLVCLPDRATECEQALDANMNGGIEISELVRAVNNALSGCPPLTTPTPSDTDYDRLARVCPDLTAELASIQNCSSDDECGQVLTGTSCGCSQNLVARSDAPVLRFYALMARYYQLRRQVPYREWPPECDRISFVSTCDCPRTAGFVCSRGRCQWNYDR